MLLSLSKEKQTLIRTICICSLSIQNTAHMKEWLIKSHYWFEHITIMKVRPIRYSMDLGLLYKHWKCPSPNFLYEIIKYLYFLNHIDPSFNLLLLFIHSKMHLFAPPLQSLKSEYTLPLMFQFVTSYTITKNYSNTLIRPWEFQQIILDDEIQSISWDLNVSYLISILKI